MSKGREVYLSLLQSGALYVEEHTKDKAVVGIASDGVEVTLGYLGWGKQEEINLYSYLAGPGAEAFEPYGSPACFGLE